MRYGSIRLRCFVRNEAMCDRPPGLLGWAFRPRNFMKNPQKRTNWEQRANKRRGFSTLSSPAVSRRDYPLCYDKGTPLIDTVPDILARIVAKKREELLRNNADRWEYEAESRTAARRDF